MASRVQNRRRLSDSQTSFAGGINTVSDDLALSPSQFRNGTNSRLTEYGAVTKRYGTLVLSVPTSPSNPPTTILGGFTWFKDDATAQTLVVSDGKLWVGNPAVIAPMTWTAYTVGGNISTVVRPTFEKFYSGSADVVYFADGGKVLSWNGTAVTRDGNGSAPSVNYLKVHNQRLWAVGDSSAPDSVFYSTLNDGTTLGHSGGGSIIVRTFGDERLVALASIGSSLMMFHRRGLSRLTGFGQDDINVDPEGVSSQTGTLARRSIVEIDGGVLFVSDRGTFLATESSVTPISTGDQPDPLLPLVRNMTEAQLELVVGVLSRDKQEVWFFLPNNGVYVYNLILRAWTGPWTGAYLNTTAMWQSPLSTNATLGVMMGVSNVVQFADRTGTYADGEDGTNPNSGTPVTLKVRLRRLYFGNDAIAKSFRFGYLSVIIPGTGDMTVSWQSNIAQYASHTVSPTAIARWSTSNVWGVGTWGIQQAAQNERIEMDGYGYYVDVTFTHSGRAIPIISRWQIDGYALGRR